MKKYELILSFGFFILLIHPCNCGTNLWTRESDYTDVDKSFTDFSMQMDHRGQWWQNTFQEID